MYSMGFGRALLKTVFPSTRNGRLCKVLCTHTFRMCGSTKDNLISDLVPAALRASFLGVHACMRMRKHMLSCISTYSCSWLSAVCLRCKWAHQQHASMKTPAPTIGATMLSTKGS